jgi:hypothetical protein
MLLLLLMLLLVVQKEVGCCCGYGPTIRQSFAGSVQRSKHNIWFYWFSPCCRIARCFLDGFEDRLMIVRIKIEDVLLMVCRYLKDAPFRKLENAMQMACRCFAYAFRWLQGCMYELNIVCIWVENRMALWRFLENVCRRLGGGLKIAGIWL